MELACVPWGADRCVLFLLILSLQCCQRADKMMNLKLLRLKITCRCSSGYKEKRTGNNGLHLHNLQRAAAVLSAYISWVKVSRGGW